MPGRTTGGLAAGRLDLGLCKQSGNVSAWAAQVSEITPVKPGTLSRISFNLLDEGSIHANGSGIIVFMPRVIEQKVTAAEAARMISRETNHHKAESSRHR